MSEKLKVALAVAAAVTIGGYVYPTGSAQAYTPEQERCYAGCVAAARMPDSMQVYCGGVWRSHYHRIDQVGEQCYVYERCMQEKCGVRTCAMGAAPDCK